MNRARFLLTLASGLIPPVAFPKHLAGVLNALAEGDTGNFQRVYGNEQLRQEFYKFLENVFHLYPEDEFHELLTRAVREESGDRATYQAVQAQLDDIKPFMSTLRYQLPALNKQKDEMARQTLELIGEGSEYNGYLEIGSSGRYLDFLEKKVRITGNRYYADGKKPGLSPADIIDRGQLPLGAAYIPMTDYQTDYSNYIDPGSLDLVTVYIGFHHCPLPLRRLFISSVRQAMRPGGKLILRDHDCHSADQQALVALAHDVFNLGTRESWAYNHREVRHFYSLKFIQEFVKDLGFRFEGSTLYQAGDPTRNALMMFTKV